MIVRLTQWLTALLFISLVSCSKEVSKETHNDTGGGQTSADFYATIGSTQWTADSLQLIQVSNGGVSINGVSSTGEQISMILPGFKTGSYTLGVQSTSYALYANLLNATPVVYVSNQANASGTVSITLIDTVSKLMSGTFQLNLVNPADNSVKTITKGVFSSIPYSGGPGVVVITPPGSGDTLTASISGVGTFNSAQVYAVDQSGAITVVGFNSDATQSLDILMPDTIVPGSYTFNPSGGLYAASFNPASDALISTQGTLTILTNDTVNKRIKGSFLFTGVSQSTTATVSVSNGYFSVNY